MFGRMAQPGIWRCVKPLNLQGTDPHIETSFNSWAAGAQGLRHCRKDLPCKSIVFYGESLYYRATNCRRVPVRLLQVGVLLK